MEVSGPMKPRLRIRGQNQTRPSSSSALHRHLFHSFVTTTTATTAGISNDHLNKLHADIVSTIKTTLDNHNVLAKSFRLARDALTTNSNNSVCLRLIGKRGKDGRRYNLPSVSEVAALIVGNFDGSTKERDIIVETKSRSLQRITELHPAYLGLQYPLLFPYGEDGWRENIILNKVKKKPTDEDKHVTMHDFFAFRIQDRPSHNGVLLYSHRLFQQFIVDAFSMVESARLKFIYTHQTEFRAEIYNGLRDAVFNGETNAASKGKRIILPATFTGGPRYMIQNYQDAMAICRCVGPDLFITFTCNLQWDKIQRYCRMHKVKPEDRPDMICRLFKVKVDMMIKDLRYNKLFGTTKAVIYTIEFQKRGLPHAHILLFLHEQDKYPTLADIDKIICAEIPDADVDNAYYEAVKSFMLHSPCGLSKPTSPCMEEGRCIRHFPKKFNKMTTVDEDDYPVYKRRDNERTVEVLGIHLDNRYVVPHNKMLLLKYRAHINVEWCNQSRSIKYLFKYVNKGSDRVTAYFSTKSTNGKATLEVDEVKIFYDCRYISPCEAAWRIFCYEIHYRNPSVERLSFRLPDQKLVVFTNNESLVEAVAKTTVKESMFLGWFAANKTNAEARKLTYNEFPSKFVWKSSLRAWEPRKSHQVIGRIIFVPPSSGELYYLRLLLNIVKGLTTYANIRTYNGVIYSSFRDACYTHDLLDDNKEYIDAIEESHVWPTCHLYIYYFLNISDLLFSDEELKDLTLIDIEQILNSNGKTLCDYPTMPFPSRDTDHLRTRNKMIFDELNYDRVLLEKQHNDCLSKLTAEQKGVYDKIMSSTDSQHGRVFFLYGHGGIGKTFLWITLASALRSRGQIVLTVASSGIASLLLSGGRTAHSRFAIPLTPDEFSTCNIKQGSPLAELIVIAKLIVWDEAPMMSKFCFEALDKTLKDLMRFKDDHNQHLPFGGKTIVFGGDFRQILPVIPKGTRQNIILQVGNGISDRSSDGCNSINIPPEFLITNYSDPIKAIVEAIYSDYIADMCNESNLKGRAILAPTGNAVDEVNDYMTVMNSNECKTYVSSNKCLSEGGSNQIQAMHTPEFLATIKCSGVPNHELKLKVGCPVMFIRNIDHSSGLCNGAPAAVFQLSRRIPLPPEHSSRVSQPPDMADNGVHQLTQAELKAQMAELQAEVKRLAELSAQNNTNKRE
ncbi:uncharacterized protein LOC107636230 [Arachis ipaensis]|uniref:uncharacterized protein LOC107636230 n=1 Tax=Arachis ipaensis TaxID=130454 RepID=UPI000A2B1A13|nr:uncharacterized protein LOC107636230 [Arachis ipaensis]XP_029148278.1 uncharacterized protein LOC112742404 [Arachis hypogaea]